MDFSNPGALKFVTNDMIYMDKDGFLEEHPDCSSAQYDELLRACSSSRGLVYAVAQGHGAGYNWLCKYGDTLTRFELLRALKEAVYAVETSHFDKALHLDLADNLEEWL